MKISNEMLNVIAGFEGFKAEAYLCPTAQALVAQGKKGFYTIGFGHVIKDDEQHLIKTKLSKEEATALLKRDVAVFETYVLTYTQQRKPNQNQFDALVSLCYNIGPGNFKKSNVLKYFLAGKDSDAQKAFLEHRFSAGKELVGLKKRRELEASWYGKN